MFLSHTIGFVVIFYVRAFGKRVGNIELGAEELRVDI